MWRRAMDMGKVTRRQFTLPDVSPTSIRFKHSATYQGGTCVECGQPATRRVGKKGWCTAHAALAWKAKRAALNDPAHSDEDDQHD